MGGRGVNLGISENRRFKRSGTGIQMSLGGQSLNIWDIASKDLNKSRSPLRAFTSDGYRIRNSENQVSQIVLFNPKMVENGFQSRPRKVSFEWDNKSGKKDDCPPRTVHKHIWNGDDKRKEHHALTYAEYGELKNKAGFPEFVQYKVEDGKGGFTYER